MKTETKPGPSDEELMVRVAGRDREAFERLLSRYERRIYAFSLRYLGSREDAEEAFQETFVRVYSRAHRFLPEKKFSTWLYTIARNICLDVLRKRARRPEESLDEMLRRERESSAPVATLSRRSQHPNDAASPSPEKLAELAEKQEIVRKALGRLPQPQREVLILRHFEGLSTAEVAEALGCSAGTVKSRLYYAFKGLERLLRPLAAEL